MFASVLTVATVVSVIVYTKLFSWHSIPIDAKTNGRCPSPSEASASESPVPRLAATKAKTKCSSKELEGGESRSLADVQELNRRVLKGVTSWITDEEIAGGVFNYGVPRGMHELLAADVGAPVNTADLNAFLSSQLSGPLVYVEIGVSVCKNLYQVHRNHCNATLLAFDIEFINPSYERLLLDEGGKALSSKEFAQPPRYELADYSSKQTRPVTLRSFDSGGNLLHYIAGDEFNYVAWDVLCAAVHQSPGHQLNYVYSDALHSITAVDFEFSMLLSRKLLSREEFAIVWDDDEGMTIKDFCRRLREYVVPGTEVSCAWGKMYGWFGVQEPQWWVYNSLGMDQKRHTIAIATTLPLKLFSHLLVGARIY